MTTLVTLFIAALGVVAALFGLGMGLFIFALCHAADDDAAVYDPDNAERQK